MTGSWSEPVRRGGAEASRAASTSPDPVADVRTPYLVERMQGFGTTIFAEMSALAVATGSVNLGQGFPDSDGPPELVEAAIAAIRIESERAEAMHQRSVATIGTRSATMPNSTRPTIMLPQ